MSAAAESVGTDENRKRTVRRWGLVAAAVVAAIVARVLMFGHESSDYQLFIKDWYDFISTHGGFGALKHDFSDYNVPYLYLKKWIPWRVLLVVPGVVLLLDVPALLAGAPLGQLLSVYAEQTSSYTALTLNAPSVYQFLPAGADAAVIRSVGVAVAGLVVLGLCLGVLLSRVRLTTTKVLLWTTFREFRPRYPQGDLQ